MDQFKETVLKKDALLEEIKQIFPEICEVRRTLHQHPELGTQEFETGRIIKECLQKWDIPYVMIADTGITASLTGKGSTAGLSTVVALRADIDALPITEPESHSFCSKNPGVMHACGHDAHTAIALGTLLLLKRHEQEFAGTVKCFFQPAEETIGGAQRMVKEGCMENPAVDYVAGLHVMPQFHTGEIEVKHGKLNASSDDVRIDIYGKGCHGAYPENGVDATLIASALLLSLQTLVSRSISPLNSAVLSFGIMEGGSAPNIICDHMVLHGTLRVLDEETRQMAHKLIRTQAASIAQAYNGSASVVFESGYDALINPDDLTDLVIELATDLIGADHIHHKEFPSLGVEDFSFFTHDAKSSVFYHLGCTKPGEEEIHPLHTDGFTLDENCLKTGMLLQYTLTRRLLTYPKK